MELEVLVATMGMDDCSLAERMNIQTSVVIANQCDRWDYEESTDGKVRMISTETRGVGINRNMALQLAKADILLFSDDDIIYYDGALQGVLDAFQEFPDADVIFFGLDMTKGGEVYERRRHPKKRLHIWNSLKFGAARMAVRRSAVEKARLSFSTLFGGGCIYGSGEDTLLICDCYRAGLKVYSHSHVLGKCSKDQSSWFSGYNEKYFYDRGAALACAFPRITFLMKWYFALKSSRKTGVPFKIVLHQMNRGIRGFSKLHPYTEESVHL